MSIISVSIMNIRPEDYLPQTGEGAEGSKLVQLLKMELGVSDGAKAVDPTKLRYALYARKSTEDEERQVRSIEDQIADCYDLIIQPKGIKINPTTDIYQEKKSAKESGKRVEFTKLIKAIKQGKYNGLIAWHYDRLARNMKEAGEIIDMVDRGILKDLQLAKATFENTPNGKMILGINFVLSKHYSDHLSESVLRGNKSSTEKGKILNQIVHGYRIVEGERWIVPDGKNFDILQRAFRMRVDEDKSLREVAEYINGMGYQAFRISKKHYNYTFDVDDVSKLFKKPLYAGVHTYGKDIVDMRQVDPDFKAMISEDEYIAMNRATGMLSYSTRHRAKRTGARDVSDFLRKFVICNHCGKFMGTSVTTKQKGYDSFRFRCDNKACEYKGSGPAGATVRDYAVKFLKEHHFSTQEMYKRYRSDMVMGITQQTNDLKSKKKSLEVSIAKQKQRYENARDVVSQQNTKLGKHFSPEYLDGLESEVRAMESELAGVKSDIDQISDSYLSYEEFLKLYKNAGELLRLTSGMSLANEIIRIFFSNFTVTGVPYGEKLKQKQWSVTEHCLCKPFDKLVENTDNSSWSG